MLLRRAGLTALAGLSCYDFIGLPCPFSEIINRKRRHIGIRIIIRIIYYPINGYPDSTLSVLSIPTLYRIIS